MKKKLVEGPFGLKMKEEQAVSLESLIKSLPKERNKISRKAAVAETSEVGERSDVSIISTDSVDRQGEVVLAPGVDPSHYLKNPVVCWNHQYEIPPVGQCLWLKHFNDKIKAKTLYASTEFGQEIFTLTQEGILKGKSIGFITLEVRDPLPDELSLRPEWKGVTIISKSLLLEFSCCGIPMNQDALVEMVSKGMTSEKTLELLGIRKTPIKKTINYAALLDQIKFDPERIAAEALKRINS